MREALHSLEVVFAWRSADGSRQVLGAEHLDARFSRELWVGTHAAHFILPASACAAVGARERFCLVRAEKTGWVLARPSEARCGALREQTLALGEAAELSFGALVFTLRPFSAVEPRLGRGRLWSPEALRWVAFAMAVHAAFLALAFFVPPRVSGLALEPTASTARYLRAELASNEHAMEPRFDQHAWSAPPDRESSTAVLAGVSVSHGRGADGAAQRGEVQTEVPLTIEQVRSAGVLQQLSGSLANIMGDEWSALGNPNRLQGMGGPGLGWDARGLAGTGFGGLHMNGHGRGACVGEHCGEEAIALSGAGLTGICGCMEGIDLAVGSGSTAIGKASTRPIAALPPVRTLEAATTGGLAREEVRRTVRRHLNEVRSCYEAELQQRPALHGRVTLRFMINVEGVTQTPHAESETPALASVGECIALASRRWSFPSSAGTTLVSYPFVFSNTD